MIRRWSVAIVACAVVAAWGTDAPCAAACDAMQVGRVRVTVVRPERYAKDPGAGFPVVLLSDVTEPTPEILAFVDSFEDAVFVCAGPAERGELLAELAKDRRLYDFPRGRVEIPSDELRSPAAAAKLRTYFKAGVYQIEKPKVTRYGARIYRRGRGCSPVPKIAVSAPWRIVEGDDGATGCDSRLCYLTVEADGTGMPAPTVEVSWPGVGISSVDGAKNVRRTADGVILTPTARCGGACYLTGVRDGAVDLALHHHVEGAQHGPYAGRPLPWTKIRASDNWRAACLEMFRSAGLAETNATDGASIRLYGFDSNFPNRHVDYPEHFHVMLEWDGWAKNNVGHYTLDERGMIRGNNFLVCGEIAGGLPRGYHRQKPGETTEYVGPRGCALFTLVMLADGSGLVLRKPGSDAAWRVRSDRPAEGVRVFRREREKDDWKDLGFCSVSDDTERGRYVMSCELCGEIRRTTVAYDRDTGRLISVKEEK